MSWADFVSNKLVNFTDNNGHAYVNACDTAAIIGCANGATWASTAGFTVSVEEYKAIEDGFGKNGDGDYKLNKEKYLMVNFDGDAKKLYLKKQGGGACVAKTNQAYIIGTYVTAKKLTKDGKEMNQNPGDCNKAVEDLQEYFLSINY